MKALVISMVLLLGSATLAHANALDDGNDGLKALQNGDNDTAINLFTRALKSGQLKGDDREFAYANRGKAYLNKGDLSDAVVDLDAARQMKPDDTDAQNDLVKAVSLQLPATMLPGQSAKSVLGQAGSLFGKALLKGIQAGIAQQGQQ